MRFDGEWLQCDDEIVRPVVRAEILGGDGVWRALELLVDTGADRTVISANVLAALNIESIQPQQQLAGAGGRISSVIIKTPLRLTRDDGEKTLFRGEYHACTAPEDLDMSVLGATSWPCSRSSSIRAMMSSQSLAASITTRFISSCNTCRVSSQSPARRALRRGR